MYDRFRLCSVLFLFCVFKIDHVYPAKQLIIFSLQILHTSSFHLDIFFRYTIKVYCMLHTARFHTLYLAMSLLLCMHLVFALRTKALFLGGNDVILSNVCDLLSSLLFNAISLTSSMYIA